MTTQKKVLLVVGGGCAGLMVLGFAGCAMLYWLGVQAPKAGFQPSSSPPKQDASSRDGASSSGPGEKPDASGWDGSVDIVDRYLETHLKDPNSLKLIDTSPVKETEHQGVKYWGVRYRYRAKNGFGAYDVSNQIFLIRGGQVVKVINSSK